MTAESARRGTFKKIGLSTALAAAGLVAVWLASRLPNADWYGTYDPAGRGVLMGHSPYDQPLFVNPPWAAVLILPFVLFPSGIARGLVLVCSLISVIYLAWRLRAPRVAVIALLFSPTAIASLLAANLDAFVMLGMLLQPAWGLLLLLVKPQIGLGAAIYYLFGSWQNGRVLGAIKTFAPLVVCSVIAALLFPQWIERRIHKPSNEWNRSLFPYGIPLGLFFLWLSLRNRNAMFALASTPFLAPYLTFPTYLAVHVALLHPDVERVVRRDLLQIILCIFLSSIMLAFRL
jgi:hypothetical protein